MTTELYLAPAAGGKTEYVLSLARQAARKVGVEVRVVVPNPQQKQAVQRRLAESGGALGVHVLNFNSLVDAVLNTTRIPYTKLDEPVKYRLLRTLTAQAALHHYEAIGSKSGFIQLLGDLIADWKGELIYPEQLNALFAGKPEDARLAELAALYQAYQDTLRAQNWADSAGMQWLALEALEALEPGTLGWPLLVVDGFDDFSPAQFALLRALQAQVERLVVTLPEAGNGRYPRYARTRREAEAALGVVAVPLPLAPASAETAVLPQLAAALFSATPPSRIDAPTAVQLMEAPDRAVEVRAALRWLKQRIVLDGCAPRDVALLARDFAPYRDHARQIAAEFGLPLHLVQGQPLLHNPAIAALHELLQLYLPVGPRGEPGLPPRRLVNTWRSSYFAWPGDEVAIKDGDADALDALARQQRVIRGLGQWQEAFASRVAAGGTETGDEDEAPGPIVAHAAAQLLRAKFDAFLALTMPPPSATVVDYVAWLDGLIGPDPGLEQERETAVPSLQVIACARQEGGDIAGDLQALHDLKEILRSLLWAEEVAGDGAPVAYATFLEELLGALSAASWTKQQEGQAVLAGSVVNLRGLPFKAAAVLGLSEGAFPAPVLEDPFLRDADRERLREALDARLLPSARSEEREHFYQAVSRPSQALLLTRPVLADNGARWIASPFWEEVRRHADVALSRLAGDTAVSPQFAASPAEWWESVATQRQLPAPSAVADDRHRVDLGAAIWEARRTTALGAYQGDLTAVAESLQTGFGPQQSFSPSRLETYQMCAFSFFARYVLNLSPREEPEEGLDVAQLGSVYHAVFERIYREATAEDLAGDEAAVAVVVARLARPVLDDAPRAFGFRTTAWWAQTRQEIVEVVTTSVIALRHPEYTFAQAEAKFGLEDMPHLVLGEGEARVRLRGLIDRVDRHADGRIRIIDYKLGGKDKFKPRAFSEGQKLQLPLYALAAQEALNLGEVADGFYWHFRKAEVSPFTLAGAEGGVEAALATAVEHALQAAARIRGGVFAPQVPEGGCPAYCAAASFCHHYSPARY